MSTETFVFFGIVGSGKGTQVKLLTDFLKEKTGKECVYAYPGNEYRKMIESGNYVGELVKDSMTKGHLQPDFLTNSIVTSILVSNLNADKHLIVDGYPRTIFQSETFETMMNFFKRNQVKIIYIELSKDEAMKRNLLRGRVDDTEEGLTRRFEEYINNVVPAMNFFQSKNGYTTYKINGEQSIENVHKDIIKALGY
jgi:adenylate kinase family enzyme